MSPAANNENTKYECRQCGSNYSRLEYLKRHERKHQDIRPFKCPKCSKEFARSDVLLRHRRRQHPDDPTLPVPAGQAANGGSPPSSAHPSRASGSPPTPSRARRRRSTATTTAGASENNDVDMDPTPAPHARHHDPIVDANQFPVVPPFQLSPHAQAHPHLHPAAFWPDFSAVQGGGLRYPFHTFPPTTSSIEPSWTTGVATTFGPPADVHQLSHAGLQRLNIHNALSADLASTTTTAHSHSASTPSSTSPATTLFPSPIALSDPALTPPTPLSALSTSPASCTFPPDGSSVLTGGGGYDDAAMQQEGAAEQERDSAATALELVGQGGVLDRLDRDPFMPEQTLLKIEGHRMEVIRGLCNRDPSDRFYVPPGFFAYCYQVDRWKLPRLSTLCALASRSLNGALVHLPFVHEPTFRLASLPGPLAFAICSVGGVASMRPHRPDYNELASWGQEILPQVRIEKADMLVRNFKKQQEDMTALEMLAVVQALLLYNAPSLMSGDDDDRLVGHLFLGTIVSIARQTGLFVPTAEHATNFSCHDLWVDGDDVLLDKKWRKWVELETYRRAAFMVYMLDTLSSLESSIPALVHPNSVAHLPLPAPDVLWCAHSAQQWALQMAIHAQVVTLDEAMADVLRPGRRTEAPPSSGNSARFVEMGPFARSVVILTLVRGLVGLGDGERSGGPVTKKWALAQGAGRWWNELDVVDSYQVALQRWKKRWNNDRLCYHRASQQPGFFDAAPDASGSSGSESSESPITPPNAATTASPSSANPPSSATATTTASSTAPPVPPAPAPAPLPNRAALQTPQYALVNHASPYYWFAQMLVSIIRSSIGSSPASEGGDDAGQQQDEERRPNRFAESGVDLRRMLFVAREYGMCHSP